MSNPNVNDLGIEVRCENCIDGNGISKCRLELDCLNWGLQNFRSSRTALIHRIRGLQDAVSMYAEKVPELKRQIEELRKENAKLKEENE